MYVHMVLSVDIEAIVIHEVTESPYVKHFHPKLIISSKKDTQTTSLKVNLLVKFLASFLSRL